MSLRYAMAALRGQAHVLEGLPCQDCTAGTAAEGVTVAVLCDGAGSCPRSEAAAACVCRWAMEFLPRNFAALWEMEVKLCAALLAERGRGALEEAGLGGVLCTMLLFACREDGRWLAAHIGDGYIFLREGGAVRVLSYPENGAFSNETFFLCEPDAEEHLRVYRGTAKGAMQALLTSDGCGESLYDLELRMPAPAVEVMCGWLDSYDGETVSRALARQLEELFSAQSDDDLSIALLSWDSGAD